MRNHNDYQQYQHCQSNKTSKVQHGVWRFHMYQDKRKPPQRYRDSKYGVKIIACSLSMYGFLLSAGRNNHVYKGKGGEIPVALAFSSSSIVDAETRTNTVLAHGRDGLKGRHSALFLYFISFYEECVFATLGRGLFSRWLSSTRRRTAVTVSSRNMLGASF